MDPNLVFGALGVLALLTTVYVLSRRKPRSETSAAQESSVETRPSKSSPDMQEGEEGASSTVDARPRIGPISWASSDRTVMNMANVLGMLSSYLGTQGTSGEASSRASAISERCRRLFEQRPREAAEQREDFLDFLAKTDDAEVDDVWGDYSELTFVIEKVAKEEKMKPVAEGANALLPAMTHARSALHGIFLARRDSASDG